MIDQITLHYCTIEKLSLGATSVVYRAEDTRPHQFVALNFLPQEVSKEPQTPARFQREALASAALHYPNMNPGRGGGAWV